MRGPTLAAFVSDVWAPRARRRLAPKTWERDSVVYEKHICPALGSRSIAGLDIEDLVEWQDGLEEAGVGDPTLIKAARELVWGRKIAVAGRTINGDGNAVDDELRVAGGKPAAG